MWIKKTKVRTPKGIYEYIQLVQSFSAGGVTRHKVAANLGRSDKIDMSAAESLIRSISSGTHDALDMREITLLPVKKYGGVLLLKKLFEQSGIRRFMSDLAAYRGFDSVTVYTVFALVSYYMISTNQCTPFFKWLEEYQVPNENCINEGSIKAASLLLNDPAIIREGLRSVLKRDSCTKYNFINMCTNVNLRDIPEDVIVSVITTDDLTVFNFEILTLTSYNKYDIFSDSDILICEDFDVINKCENVNQNEFKYICKIKKEDLRYLFLEESPVCDYVFSRGRFEAYEDVGYKCSYFEGKKIFVIRPEPGDAGDVAPLSMEPRDVIVTNVDLEDVRILKLYFHTEKIQNYFFNVYLPPDFNFLYHQIPPDELLHMVLNLYFLNYFFFNMIERKGSLLGMSTEDVFSELDDIVAAELCCGPNTRDFHSALTERHTTILGAMDLSPHPSIKLTKNKGRGMKSKK